MLVNSIQPKVNLAPNDNVTNTISLYIGLHLDPLRKAGHRAGQSGESLLQHGQQQMLNRRVKHISSNSCTRPNEAYKPNNAATITTTKSGGLASEYSTDPKYARAIHQ